MERDGQGRGPESSNNFMLVPENTTATPWLDIQSAAYDLPHTCAPATQFTLRG